MCAAIYARGPHQTHQSPHSLKALRGLGGAFSKAPPNVFLVDVLLVSVLRVAYASKLLSVGLEQLSLLEEVFVFSLRGFSRILKEALCSLGEGLSEAAVTSLVLDEVDIFGGRSLGVDGKRILALCLSARD